MTLTPRTKSLCQIGLATGLAILIAVFASATGAQQQAPSAWRDEWPTTDFAQTAVDFGEILSGGPPKDGIPSIDDPSFLPVGDVREIHTASAPVLSLEIGGDARAYPLSIMIWHEIVNDTVGGLPVAVTYCPLCNAGLVFERNVAGSVTTFGTTGKLRHSDLVMYDRATESWWQQFSGRAIVGARLGETLKKVPARLESFGRFAERHPHGKVLTPPQAVRRAYGRNPYVGYDTAVAPFLYRGEYTGPGTPLMRVVAVEGADRAWSLPLLRERQEIRHGELIVSWSPGQASALDAPEIAAGRDVGTVSVSRVSADGRREAVVYDVPFAFAYNAFHPELPIEHTD